jgi:hypothetical protein
LAGDDWARYFTDFRRIAFRLETLPQYLVTAEAEDFPRFLAGAARPDGYNSEWHEVIRANSVRGKRMSRVHLVTPPLSDYLRFEFTWAYPGNVAAGEDIRILDLAERPNVDLPDEDFWLFDDTVVRMLYEPDGRQIGRWLERDADPARYLGYRDAALAHAVPFQDYLVEHPL